MAFSSYVVIHFVNWRKVAPKKSISFCSSLKNVRNATFLKQKHMFFVKVRKPFIFVSVFDIRAIGYRN